MINNNLPIQVAKGLETWSIVGELAVIGAKTATKGVVAATQAVKKWNTYRPARYKLIACPEADAVLEQWIQMKQGRDILDVIRFGAMLLNVSQYVDCSPIYGRGKHIVARNPGLKGWLRNSCPKISYVTAMNYRKAAELVCKAIGLPEFIPLEWVLPGTEEMDDGRELNPENKLSIKLKHKDVLRQIRECRGKLKTLLDGATNLNQLFAKLDAINQGHRSRKRVKIVETPTQEVAAKRVLQHLKSANLIIQSLTPDIPLENHDTLLSLLRDLKGKIESRPDYQIASGD